MDYIEKRQRDPEYLKTVIAQRQIVIEQRQREITNQQKQIQKLNEKIHTLQSNLAQEQQNALKESINLKKALQQYERLNDQLKNEKNQLEYKLNRKKNLMQQTQKQHTKQIYKLKNDFDAQKEALNMKITKLEKNLVTLNTQYHVQEEIQEDKHKIIEDANRNLRGFANQQQQRMIVIQNQQLTIQIQFQSKQITSLHQRNQKLQQQIKQYRTDLQLHKNMQNDLVKRSSLAQNLIKQLNKRIKQLQSKLQTNKEIITKLSVSSSPKTQNKLTSIKKTQQSQSQVSYQSSSRNSENRDLEEKIAKLKFENAKLQNYNHFLENSQKNNNKKYETLGQIMGQYLEAKMYLENNSAETQNQLQADNVVIDMGALKNKDLKEWTRQQVEIVLNLLITHIKPYMSAESLAKFPQPRNIKVSFVEQQSKQAISLPKIVSDYQQAHKKQVTKQNRFKDIPVDISTKILRSNLREWGQKIPYGSMPKGRKFKSNSIIAEPDRSMV